MDLYLPIVLTVTLVMVGLVIGGTWSLTRAAERRRRELEQSGDLGSPE